MFAFSMEIMRGAGFVLVLLIISVVASILGVSILVAAEQITSGRAFAAGKKWVDKLLKKRTI